MVQAAEMKPSRGPVLTAEQEARYRHEGFLTVPAVFSIDTVKGLRAECRRLWASVEHQPDNPRIQWRKSIEGKQVTDRIDPVLDLSPVLQSLAYHPLLLHIVAQLLVCNAPEIFKSKLISKWPGTGGYGLHQDFSYWFPNGGPSPDSFLTVIVALDTFTPASGSLELFPGLNRSQLPPPRPGSKDIDEENVDFPDSVIASMEPGEVLLLHGLTPHRSGPNTSENNRESLFITYTTEGLGKLGDEYYSSRPIDFMNSQ